MGIINNLVYNKEMKTQLNQLKQDVNNAIKKADIDELNSVRGDLVKFTQQYAEELTNNEQMGDTEHELYYKIDKAKLRLYPSVEVSQYWNNFD